MNTTQATLSLYLTKGSNKLDCYTTIGWKALLMTNTSLLGLFVGCKENKVLRILPCLLRGHRLTKLFWSSNYSPERPFLVDQGREPLLKGTAQYSWPLCTNQCRSQPFHIENIVYLFTKQATLMRRSIVLRLPLQLVFPGQSNSTRRGKPAVWVRTKFCSNFVPWKDNRFFSQAWRLCVKGWLIHF